MMPTFAYLNDVHIGTGIRARLPCLLEQLGIRRPLIVTDEHLVALGYVDELALDFRCVFDKVATNPTEAQALAGLVQYRQKACDGIIALGGDPQSTWPRSWVCCPAILAPWTNMPL